MKKEKALSVHPSEKARERRNDLAAIKEAKQIERKKKKLVRVELNKGYVLTNNPAKWEEYNKGVS